MRQGNPSGKFAFRSSFSNKNPKIKESKSQIPAILVSRQCGGIGDMLMITPTIKQIKQDNPDIPLIVCTTLHYGVRGELVSILQHNPYIDKVVTVEGLCEFIFKKVYNFNTGKETKIETDPNHPTGNRIDIFAELAEVSLSDKQPVYIVIPSEIEWAKNWVKKNVSEKKRRLIGISDRASMVRRTWPPEKQWLLAFRILNTYPDSSILFFHEGVAPDTDVYPNIYQIQKFSIRQVAALINECELLIVPDSGLLHVAGALGKKMVGLFGPNPPDSRLLYYKNSIGVWLNYPCSVENCWYERCFYQYKCMTEITVEQVLEKVKELIDTTMVYNKREKMEETLFIRMGGVGDLIMLSSSLREYKKQHPDEKLVLATNPVHLKVLKDAPFLERVIPIPESYRYNFRRVIDLRHKVESPEVGGSLDTEIYKKVNRMDVFDQLVGVSSEEKLPYVYVDQDNVKTLKESIKYSTKYKWLGIHVSCTSNTRTTPPEYIPEIVKKFKKINKLKIVLVGTTEFWGGRIAKINFQRIKGRNIVNMVDKTDLTEVIDLLSLMDFIIGPDSVAIHVAGALGKKCLALFGNIDPNKRIFYYPTVKAIYPLNEIPCIPCHDFINPCLVTDDIGGGCMRKITPDRIFEEAKIWFEISKEVTS